MKYPRRRLEDELHDVWNDWINDNDYGLWHDVPQQGALGAVAAAVGAAAPPDNDAPGEMLDGDEFPIVLAAGGRAAVADPDEGPRRAAAPAVVPVALPRRAASRRQQPLIFNNAAAPAKSIAGTVTSAVRGAAALGARGLKGAAALGVRAGKHILKANGLGGLLPSSRSASVAPAARAASRAAPRPETAAGTGLLPPTTPVVVAPAPNADGGTPSLDGLRLNAQGRVVNSQGRFVSQHVAALYLQRHPVT